MPKNFKPMIDSVRPQINVGQILRFSPGVTASVESFLLSPEIADEADKLLMQAIGGRHGGIDDEKIDRLHELAKLPHPTMLVEWPITENMWASDHSVANGVKKVPEQVTHVGVLFHKDDPNLTAFEATTLVRMSDGFCDLSLGGLIIDTIENIDKLPTKPQYRRFGKFGVITCVSFLLSNFFDCLADPRQQEDQFEKVKKRLTMEQMLASIHEAMYVLLGVLPILNSKSGATQTVIPAVKPPASFGARKKKELSRSKYTVISLTDYEEVDGNGIITPRKLAAAHKVRGHFKRKKNGIFWWRPHIRGQGELQQREAYLVQA